MRTEGQKLKAENRDYFLPLFLEKKVGDKLYSMRIFERMLSFLKINRSFEKDSEVRQLPYFIVSRSTFL